MNENETNRIDEFRQFKRQVRGSKQYLIVGLDIAKRKHHAFFGDANGRALLKGLIVENTAEGLRHLLTQVRFYMDREGLSNVVFGLELRRGGYHAGVLAHRRPAVVAYPQTDQDREVGKSVTPFLF